MKDAKLVWSDEQGDLRKKKESGTETAVNESELILKLRRLSSGKGRTVVEITGLPKNQSWCKNLASDLKKSLGVGGAYKADKVEIHLDNIEKITTYLEKKNLRWKKTGG